ncbi:MAG: hypothetical protein U0441_14085 [Polyangiaceae bacterium]
MSKGPAPSVPVKPGDFAGDPAFFGATEPDPELTALPAPPRRERTFAVVMMCLTAAAALTMSLLLFEEARYALAPSSPNDVGDLATLKPTADMTNHYTFATGLLGTTGAIRYARTAESDSFRLMPVAGNPSLWVEIRVPEGFEGPRFVPPTKFAGRLVPMANAGMRHVGLSKAVKDQTDVTIPEDAWLLIDGSSPRASRWAIALAALFVAFAGWNIFGVARVMRSVKDDRKEERKA